MLFCRGFEQEAATSLWNQVLIDQDLLASFFVLASSSLAAS
jgi:hypothetical protein